MISSLNKICRFLKAEDGPTAVEYAILLGLIIITALASIGLVGQSVRDMWGGNLREILVRFTN